MRALKAKDIIDIMTEYPGNYILVEPVDHTSGDITSSLILLKDSDGSDAEIADEDGRLYSPELTPDVFNELLHAGRIRENGTPDETRHQTTFILAAHAKKHGEAA